MCGAFYFPQNHLIQFHWFYFLIKSCYILNYLSTDSDNGTYSCFHMWFFKMYLFLNWRIIALQNCVGFCQTSPWMSHAAKSLQSCPTLCDPMDCSLPGFSVHGILQAKTLEWVAISFSNAWKWKVKVESESEVAQSCLTLCDPMDCSLPGSSIHGIFQATVLKWVAIVFSLNEP